MNLHSTSHIALHPDVHQEIAWQAISLARMGPIPTSPETRHQRERWCWEVAQQDIWPEDKADIRRRAMRWADARAEHPHWGCCFSYCDCCPGNSFEAHLERVRQAAAARK